MKARGILYLIAKTLGDFSAAKKGHVGRRIKRRLFGKFSGRILRRF